VSLQHSQKLANLLFAVHRARVHSDRGNPVGCISARGNVHFGEVAVIASKRLVEMVKNRLLKD
jgi:hypothetical protein